MDEIKSYIEVGVEKIVQPHILLLFVVFILCVDRYFFDKKHLSCIGIIEVHIKKIKSERHGNFSIFVYFVIPLIISVALGITKVLDDGIINTVTVIISILTAMFFTLLTLVIDIRTKVKDNQDLNASDANVMKKVLKETYYAIMFEITISIFLLVACFVNLFAGTFDFVMSVSIYYMTLVLLFNLFTILRHVFKIIEQSLK